MGFGKDPRARRSSSSSLQRRRARRLGLACGKESARLFHLENLEERRLFSGYPSISGASQVNVGQEYDLAITYPELDPENPGTPDLPHSLTIEWGDGATDTFYAPDLPTGAAHWYGSASWDYPVVATAWYGEDDSDGPYASNVQDVEVDGPPEPTLSLSAPPPATVGEGGVVNLNFGYSVDNVDPGVSVELDGTVDWGDGTTGMIIYPTDSTSGTLSLSHRYAQDRTVPYAVGLSLMMAGAAGGAAASTSAPVTVEHLSSTVTLTGAPGVVEGSPYTLTLSYFDPGVDKITSWDVDWGDGSDPDHDGTVGQHVTGTVEQLTRLTLTHVYDDGPNSYVIRATAHDPDGDYTALGPSVDATFGGGSGSVVLPDPGSATGVVVQPDGKIVLAGKASVTSVKLDILNEDGSVQSVVSSPAGEVGGPSAATGEDLGRVLVAGGASDFDFRVARFNPDGTPDRTFGAISASGATATAIDSGTAHSNATVSGGARWVAGHDGTGYALDFDGMSGAASVGSPSSLQVSGSTTLAAWVRSEDLTSNGTLIGRSYGTTSSDAVFLRINAGYYEAGTFDGTTTHAVRFAVPAGDLGRWVHLAATYDVALHLWTLYRNGDAVATAGDPVGPVAATGSYAWRMGYTGWSPSLSYFHGTLDDVQVYASCLDASDVGRVLTGQDPLSAPAAKARWRFDEGNSGVAHCDFGSTTDVARAVAVQADGKIVIAGSSNGDFAVARFNADGTPDTTFGAAHNGRATIDLGGDDQAWALAVDPLTGAIVVAGTSAGEFAVARFNADGTVDASFNGGVSGQAGYVLFAPPGGGASVATGVGFQPVLGGGTRIVAGGTSGHSFAVAGFQMTDGAPDATFGARLTDFTDPVAADSAATALVVQPDGKVVLGGYTSNGRTYDFAAARYDAGGDLDTTFGTGGKVTVDLGPAADDRAAAMALDAWGRIVLSGSSGTKFAVARLLPSSAVAVSDAAPGALFTASAGTVAEGGSATVGFTGTRDVSVADTDAGFTYSYDFDDDGTWDLVGPSATATVPASVLVGRGSSHTIVGRVSDKDGKYRDYRTVITVIPQLTASPYVAGPAEARVGQDYRLDLFAVGASFDSWSIDWGDGTPVSTPSAGATYVTHQFATAPARVMIRASIVNGGNPTLVSSLGLDTTYGTDGRRSSVADGGATAFAVQADGRVVALANGTLERFGTDGQLDPAFGSGGHVTLPSGSNWTAVTVAANGEIAVGGSNGSALVVAAYSPDGRTLRWQQSGGSFGGGTAFASAVAYAGGEVVVAGGYVEPEREYYAAAAAAFGAADGGARWANRVASATIHDGAPGYAYEQVAVDPTSGYATLVRANGLAVDQVDGEGTLTQDWVTVSSPVTSLAIRPNGQILLGGDGIRQYFPDGTPDENFGSGGTVATVAAGGRSFYAVQLLPQSDGRLAVVGQTGDGYYLLSRYDNDGTLDVGFGVGGTQAQLFADDAPELRPQVVRTTGGGYRLSALSVYGTVDLVQAYGANAASVVGPPNASALVVPAAFQNRPVTVSAKVTSGGGLNDVLTYRWTVTHGGTVYALPNGGVTSGPSLTFTPDTADANWTVSLSVTDQTLSPVLATVVGPTSFTVGAAPLDIVGPAYVTLGSRAHFVTTAPWAQGATADPRWSVVINGSESAPTGGTEFDWVVSQTGPVTVKLTATGPNGPVTATLNLDVEYVAPTVDILGAPVGFAGHAMSFDGTVKQAPGLHDALTYAWKLVGPNGEVALSPADVLSTTDTSTLVVPGLPNPAEGAVDTYQLLLTVYDQHGGQVQQRTAFTVSADPTSPDFSFTSVPLALDRSKYYSGFLQSGDSSYEDHNSATVEAVQPDGKIVVAGFVGGGNGWSNYGNTINDPPGTDSELAGSGTVFIARFNPDLTLDTTFGPDRTGFSVSTTAGFPQGLGLGDPHPLAITINPLNGDIVLVGDYRIYSNSGAISYFGFGNAPWVGEFLSTPRLGPNGQMLPAGSIDPGFNGGKVFVLQDNPNVPLTTCGQFQYWYGIADAVTALDDGSILVGGVQDAIHSAVPYGASSYSAQDFLLFKLTAPSGTSTSGGTLDASFGVGGVAPNTWVNGSTAAGPLFTTHNAMLYADVKSILVQDVAGGGQRIVIGGYASTELTPSPLDPDPPSGVGSDFGQIGFMVQGYHLDGPLAGTLDASFGTGGTGQTFIGAGDFGADGNAAYLGGLEILSDGGFVAAGIVSTVSPLYTDPEFNTDPAYPSYGYPLYDHVFKGMYDLDLARYDSGGHLVNTVSTGIHDLAGPGAEYFPDDFEGYTAEYLAPFDSIGQYGFDPTDGSVFATTNNYSFVSGDPSILPPQWSVAHVYVDGSSDASYGPGGVATFVLPDDTLYLNVPGTVLVTGTGVYASGIALDRLGPGYGGPNESDPILIRYNRPGTAAPELTARADEDGAVELTWSDVATADGYYVERAPAGSTSFTPIATVARYQRTYTDAAAGLVPGAAYQYQLVPFAGTAGSVVLGTPSGVAGATVIGGAGTLVQSLDVPMDGSTVDSAQLDGGRDYLVVVSGDGTLAPVYDGQVAPAFYRADAAYWFLDYAPSVHGATLDYDPAQGRYAPFGLGLGGYAGAGPDDAVPDWGPFDRTSHTYVYRVHVTDAGSLSFRYHDADQSSVPSAFAAALLHVNIYDLSGSGTAASSSTTPVRRITSPAATGSGLPPTIGSATPVSILSATPAGGAAPWRLLLVPAGGGGTAITLATGNTFAGTLPTGGASVAVIDPARYANGLYELELTDGSGNVWDAEPVNIQSISKLGDLVFSAADAVVRSSGGTVTVSRVYDSADAGDAGSFGDGWGLNLLDSQMRLTHQVEGYDPTHFSSEALRPGDRLYFFGPGHVQYPVDIGVGAWGFAWCSATFDPQVIDASDPQAIVYGADFVALDPLTIVGQATVRVVRRTSSLADAAAEPSIQLVYRPALDQFQYQNGDGQWVVFNPANPTNDVTFEVTSSDGAKFLLDPVTGEVLDHPLPGSTGMWTSTGQNFGYNSLSNNLNSGLTYYHGTGGGGGDSVGTGLGYDTSAMRVGDLVSLTTPTGGTDVFEFAPSFTDAASASSAPTTGLHYQATFIALDGSGATLKVIADPSSAEGMFQHDLKLAYDRDDDEFLVLDSGYKYVGFDPSDPLLGLAYQLTTAGGDIYVINATTGRIESCTTSAGLTVYKVADDGNIVDGDGRTLVSIGWSDGPLTSKINSIQVSGQEPIYYRYDTTGNLVGVTDQAGKTTVYSYADSTNVHLLTGVANSLGVSVLSAQYAPTVGLPTDGMLLSVTDRNAVNMPIGTLLPAGAVGVRTVADAAGNVTQAVFGPYGNVVRAIKPVISAPDAPGELPALTGYLVSAIDTRFAQAQLGNPSPGIGTVTVLASVTSYSAFQVAGSDPGSLRYLEEPLSSTMTQETAYVTGGPFLGQVESSTQRIDFAGTLEKTINLNFALVNSGKGIVKPLTVVTEIDTPDTASSPPQGMLRNVKSIAAYQYDADGNLVTSVRSIGAKPGDGTRQFAEGTRYVYNGGLLTYTYNVTAEIEATVTPGAGLTGGSGTIVYGSVTPWGGPVSSNVYYATSDGAGASKDKVEYGIDAAGQRTFYAYNAAGQAVLNYTYKAVLGQGGLVVGVWVGTTSVYDGQGRLTDVYRATYRSAQSTTDGSPVLYVLGAGTNGLAVNTAKNPVYSPDSAPLRTSHTDYNDLGQVADTVDPFGGKTAYAYDANGRTIRTVSPDGTTVLTVYDQKGRVVWATDPFKAGYPIVATNTVYSDLGQVVETSRYVGTQISFSGSATALVDPGTKVSSMHQVYNAKGQVVETVSPSGLRAGTVYYPDGSAACTGVLADGAPANWYEGDDATTLSDPSVYFASYTINQYSRYDDGGFYDEVTDQRGNSTRTYQDGEGRTVRTVYADGSFIETLYGFGGGRVEADLGGQSVSDPTDWQGVPAGGRETVTVGQRKAGDPRVLTYSVYDAANRLVDVYLPAVADMDPASPTYSPAHPDRPVVNPHWSYAYDAAGNEVIQVSPKEQHDYQLWLGAGAGLTTGDGKTYYYTPFAGGTTFAYDQYGRQLSETLPDDAPARRETRTTSYNRFGQTLISVDFDGQSTAYTYDNTPAGQGRLTGKYFFAAGVAPLAGGQVRTTAAAQSVVYSYDGLGRQKTVADDSGLTTYAYDAQGNVIQEVTPEGTINYVYDETTGLHVETWTGTDHDAAVTDTLYGYDKQGRLKSVTSAKLNGATPAAPAVTANQYDAVGNPTPTPLPTTVYDYDAAGNKVGETLPTGEVTTYTYDKVNRLTNVVEKQGATTLFSQTYVLNDDGTRAGVAERQLRPDGTIASIYTAWTYDADGRLTGEQRVAGVPVADGGAAASFPASFVLPAADSPTGADLTFTWSGDVALLNGTLTAGAWVSDGYGGAYGHSGDAGVAIFAPDVAAALKAAAGLQFAAGSWGMVYNDGAGSGYAWGLSAPPTASNATVASVDGPAGSPDPSAGGALAASSFVPVELRNADYADAYTYDLQNNRMSKVHAGPVGGPDLVTTYAYNGDDEQVGSVSVTLGTAGFTATSSTYDANGSLINQYGGSAASADSFGAYTEADTSVSTSTGQTATAASVGLGGAVVTWFTHGASSANATTVLPNGDVLAVGYATDDVGHRDVLLAAYRASDGTLDDSFGTSGYVLTDINGFAGGTSVAIVSDGGSGYDVLVGGYARGADGYVGFLLVRYHAADGSLDAAFGDPVPGSTTDRTGWTWTNVRNNAQANSMAVLPDGSVVLAGYAGGGSSGYAQSIALAEYTAAGAIVPSFGTLGTGVVLTAVGGESAANAVAAVPAGSSYRIAVAGYGYDGGGRAAVLAEYDAGGHAVTTFGTGGTGGVVTTHAGANGEAAWDALAVSGSNLVAAGYGTDGDGRREVALGEFTATTGVPVAAFGAGGGVAVAQVGGGSEAVALMIAGDGKILLTGYGTTLGLSPHPSLLLARYTGAGRPDATFGIDGVVLPPTGVGASGVGLAACVISSTDGTVAVVGQVGSGDVYVAEYRLAPQVTTYSYDLRNKLVAFDQGSTHASYVYDDGQNRVRETVGGTTTYYLTDTANPTGYAQPVEARVGSTTAAPSITYVLGDRVTAQADGTGAISYLLVDGHGSTRLLTDADGTVTAAFGYDAFGTALDFDPAAAGTVLTGTAFLFGGDAVYDPTSGLYFHGNGVRPTLGFLFIQRDTYRGSNDEPASLHKYVYANDNPVSASDPSGRSAYVQSGNIHSELYVDVWRDGKVVGLLKLSFASEWWENSSGVESLLAGLACIFTSTKGIWTYSYVPGTHAQAVGGWTVYDVKSPARDNALALWIMDWNGMGKRWLDLAVQGNAPVSTEIASQNYNLLFKNCNNIVIEGLDYYLGRHSQEEIPCTADDVKNYWQLPQFDDDGNPVR